MTEAELIRLLKAEIQDLEDQLAGSLPSADVMDDLNLRSVKLRVVKEAMRRSDNIIAHAAKMLGTDRWTLTKYLKRNGLFTPTPPSERTRVALRVIGHDALKLWKLRHTPPSRTG